jgi:hypothetical protein
MPHALAIECAAHLPHTHFEPTHTPAIVPWLDRLVIVSAALTQ